MAVTGMELQEQIDSMKKKLPENMTQRDAFLLLTLAVDGLAMICKSQDQRIRVLEDQVKLLMIQ